MIYVLIVMFASYTQPTVMYDFVGEKSCLAAANEIRGAVRSSNIPEDRRFRVVCVPKGEFK